MVLVAIAVIGLPLLLDGSGSASRFRHVEQLREEPPRIIVPSSGSPADADPSAGRPGELPLGLPLGLPLEPSGDPLAEPLSVPGVDPALPSGVRRGEGTALESGDAASDEIDPLTAWVVQAGSFGDQENAIALRERLRAAGFPSFVSETGAAGAPRDANLPPVFRVQVGPMVDRERALELRERVATLLGGAPIVVAYP